MTSEDWKTVLLAFIATIGGVLNAIILVYVEHLRRKQTANDKKTDDATVASKAAEASANEAKRAVNGRLDELLQSAKEKAFLEGKAAALAEAAAVSVAQQKAKVAADAVAKEGGK
jgi:chromosomal replication initiation ATPase DnaA